MSAPIMWRLRRCDEIPPIGKFIAEGTTYDTRVRRLGVTQQLGVIKVDECARALTECTYDHEYGAE